ncbi:phage Gp37/Gp68 family protein [Corallococcus macrosporus]|uniref:Phage Gp37/Gp68 family protein n=1 Tax=Corallococcus macrosporus TaxID=35 RepID=A0ABS3DDX6_9BACT|nr:phage Gp37/Gp68 family protein [Corallococcus macrosporus]MBN8229868.1 phage Gp37/Gp68 family protein [Corallococcus macrosporus]
MADNSKIEWTDATWNPVRGCVKLSPGCKHCYAETFAERFRGVPGHPYEQGFDLKLIPGKLAEPLRWKAPKRVFVNSMSDLFLDEVPEAYIETVARVMALAGWHTFQVLTKRAERMQRLLSTRLAFAARLPNVWWGVSVEDRKYGLPRVKHLQATPARVRFLSIEPLLEDLGTVDFTGVDGVIVGGESGAKARPLDPDWVRSVREQCAAAGVAFFFKQWGGKRKAAAGRVLDGRTYDALPRSTVAPFPEESRRLRLLEEAEALAAPWLAPPALSVISAAASA